MPAPESPCIGRAYLRNRESKRRNVSASSAEDGSRRSQRHMGTRSHVGTVNCQPAVRRTEGHRVLVLGRVAWLYLGVRGHRVVLSSPFRLTRSDGVTALKKVPLWSRGVMCVQQMVVCLGVVFVLFVQGPALQVVCSWPNTFFARSGAPPASAPGGASAVVPSAAESFAAMCSSSQSALAVALASAHCGSPTQHHTIKCPGGKPWNLVGLRQ